MTPLHSAPPRPPRWATAVVERALPRDSMRDAILGDLYEEFIDDVQHAGERLARVRAYRRAVGIALYATVDRLTCRSWASDDATAAGLDDAASPVPPVAAEGGVPVVASAVRLNGVARYAMISLLGFVVLLVGIVGNTMLFTATEPHSVRITSAAGVGGVVLFVACAAFAAMIVCAGPRWRRRRLRET